MNEVYLVTGTAGHLGRTVIQDLLNDNKTIRILVLPNEKYIPKGKLIVFFGDVTNMESLHPFFDCPSDSEMIVTIVQVLSPSHLNTMRWFIALMS